MTASVAGVYKEGKIELFETPKGLREGRVRVVLIQEEPVSLPPRYLEYGKYKGSKDPSLEDFKDTEWNGEAEFDRFRS